MRMKFVLSIIFMMVIVACSRPAKPLKLAPNTIVHAISPWGNAVYYSQSRRINCLLVTEDDLWAGTNQGLQQWSLEGNRYQVITSRDGLPSDIINSLAVSTTGTVWVATDKGLSAWSSGSWQNQTLPLEGEPTALAATVAGDAIWAGTTRGLAFYVFGRWIVYSTKVHVTQLRTDSGSGVWLGTKNSGLFVCENGECKPRTTPIKEVTAIDIDGDNVWVAGYAANHETLFTLLQPGKSYTYDAPGPVSWIQRLGGNVIMNFGTTVAHVVPCTKQSQNKFVARTSGAPCFEAQPFSRPLPMRITTAYRTGGNLWLGTETLGVTRYTDTDMQQYSTDDLVSPNIVGMSLECVPASTRCYFSAGKNSFVYEANQGFRPIQLSEHPGWSLSFFTTSPDGILTAVAKNPQGTIGFFVRDSQGNWNPRGDTPLTLETQDTNVRIRFAHFTKPHIIWVGLSSSNAKINGIKVVNFETGKINPPRNYFDIKNKPAVIPDSVKSLYKRGDNRYLATNEGLVILLRGSETRKTLQIINSTNGLFTDVVEDVLVEPNGVIWLATDMGVCVRQNENAPWKCGSESPMPNTGHTYSIARDPQTGTIYVASEKALFRIREGRTETLDAERFLQNPKVIDMKIDHQGTLWVLHPEALSLVHLSTR